jgi:hypothetical protein
VPVTSLSGADVITAAVALDDVEWGDYAMDLRRRPKEAVAEVLTGSFSGGILSSGLRSCEDVQRAIERLSDLASEVLAAPARARTLMEAVPPLPDDGATESELQEFERTMKSVVPRLRAAATARNRLALRELAADFKSAMPWLTDDRRAERPPGDADTVRRVFTAFLQTFSSWFGRDEWNGSQVPKSSAYYLLDRLAFAPTVDVRRSVVQPLLRDLSVSLGNDEARDAVLQSLQEMEELDGRAG